MLIRLVPYLYYCVQSTDYRVQENTCRGLYVCTLCTEIPAPWEPHRVHLGHPRIELERELELGDVSSLPVRD